VELLPPKLANPSYRNRIWVTVDQTFVEHGTNASESSKETGPLNNDSMESRIEIGEAPTGSSISFYVLEWQGGSTVSPSSVSRHILMKFQMSHLYWMQFTDERGVDRFGTIAAHLAIVHTHIR